MKVLLKCCVAMMYQKSVYFFLFHQSSRVSCCFSTDTGGKYTHVQITYHNIYLKCLKGMLMEYVSIKAVNNDYTLTIDKSTLRQ